MRTPPRRDPSKQVTAQTTCASWILRMQTKARTVKTCNTAHIVHPGGQRLWREIHLNKDNVNHLIQCLKKKYELTKDWDGNLYCSIKLNWNYNNRTLYISMPGYIIKQRQKYKHAISPPNRNIARILHSHANTVAKHKDRCPLILPHPSQMPTLSISNGS
jgi:hypothetical protein